MSKVIINGIDAKIRIINGAKKLADTVAVTMGPQGRNVIMTKSAGAPIVTKDGVSVAREFVLDDVVENVGCSLIKESAGRTAEIAGDGTTTTTVLASSILQNGLDFIKDNSGINMLSFRKGFSIAQELMINEINKLSKEIITDEELKNIAIISANNDVDLGSVIAGAFSEVGKGGMVTAEASPGVQNSFRVVDGIELPTGYISSHFLESGCNKVTLENANILIVNDEISHVSDPKIVDFLNKIASTNKPLFLICKDLNKEALAFFATNHKAGRIKFCAIKIPNYGRRASMWLDDLSMVLGAIVIDDASMIGDLGMSSIGFASKIEATNFFTTITGPRKNIERINQKIKLYHDDLEILISDSEAKDLKNRIAFLSNKAAIITVGYNTELELREKGDRIDDATSAVKAALLEGYVPGGGFALASSAMNLLENINDIDEDCRSVSEIVFKSCLAPSSRILDNAGVISSEILAECNNKKCGFNSATYQYGDMIKMGIIDPRRVVISALKNAISISLLILTTDSIVAEDTSNPSGWQPPAGWRPPSSSNLNHKN